MATEARVTRASPQRITRLGILRRVSVFVEAHPVWAIFLLALAVRVIVAIGVAIIHPANIAPDGIQYSSLASAKATGHTGGWDAYDHWLYTRVATLLVPITGLYDVFGTHPITAQLYVALLGAGTAAVTTRLAMEVLPTRWALAAGLIVALLPSQVAWSSLILKDAGVWLCLSAIALTIAIAGRSRGPRLALLGLLLVGLLVLLGYLRLQTLVVACWAVMLAALVGPRLMRRPRIAGAVAIGVLVPWLVFGLGPAGVTYVKNSQPPSEIRANGAIGAKSALAAPPSSSSSSSATAAANQSEVGADVHHLPRGVEAMLFQPFPWQGGSIYFNLARVEDLMWYPLLLLAFTGLLTLRPRHLRVMAYPLLAGGAILVLYALTEGNLGTAFRHRGEFEWVMALLAAFGIMRCFAWWSRSRSPASRGEAEDARSAGPATEQDGVGLQAGSSS
jgi:4-amino-4-deoxy-L-arabinose transferase-like glycosyltransferase